MFCVCTILALLEASYITDVTFHTVFYLNPIPEQHNHESIEH